MAIGAPESLDIYLYVQGDSIEGKDSYIDTFHPIQRGDWGFAYRARRRWLMEIPVLKPSLEQHRQDQREVVRDEFVSRFWVGCAHLDR
jgi:hypothetical protein